jgi:hypothetical protein
MIGVTKVYHFHVHTSIITEVKMNNTTAVVIAEHV